MLSLYVVTKRWRLDTHKNEQCRDPSPGLGLLSRQESVAFTKRRVLTQMYSI